MTTTTTADKIVELLGRVPLFEGLRRPDLERIAGLLRSRSAQTGELLFREGDPGDKFYIIFAGSVEILKERPRGDHERLAVKRAGEAFGELSLLTAAPRSASVRALEPTQLLVASRARFEALLGGETLAIRLMRSLARALPALDARFAARESGGGAEALRHFSRLVQQGLLPRQLSRVEGYDIAGAAVLDEAGLGQALWYAGPFAGGEALLSVLGVKGSGLPPGHFLGVARALLREIAATERDFPQILPRLGAALAGDLFEGLDEYLEVGLVALDGEGPICAAAGGQPGVVVRATGAIEELAASGPPLGILPCFEYVAQRVRLAAGDTLLLLSEAERGLLRGAADLVRERRADPAGRLATLLKVALRRAEQVGGSGRDLAFIIIKRT